MAAGDKQETAVNIARSAGLVTQPHDAQLLVLNASSEEGAAARVANRASAACAHRGGLRPCICTAVRVPRAPTWAHCGVPGVPHVTHCTIHMVHIVLASLFRHFTTTLL